MKAFTRYRRREKKKSLTNIAIRTYEAIAVEAKQQNASKKKLIP